LEINETIWLDEVVIKIARKHKLTTIEVDEVFYNKPKYKKVQKGKLKDEDLYFAYGRTDSGRYLVVIFIYKKSKDALIVTARDMDLNERQSYAKK